MFSPWVTLHQYQCSLTLVNPSLSRSSPCGTSHLNIVQEQDANAAADEEFCRQLMLEESQARALEEADAKLAKQLLDEEYANRQAQPGTAAAVPFQTKPPPPPPPKRVSGYLVVGDAS